MTPITLPRELKPCPSCGETGLDFDEGSTFRWLLPSCKGCGATCGEVRVQTMGEGTPGEWRAAAEADAIDAWNRRSALYQPDTEQAEALELRRMLCASYAGAKAYMDDGEASDCSTAPFIDFLRDGVQEIRSKMRARAATREMPPAQPTQEPEYWQWRRKGQPWSLDKTFNSRVFATTDDSEVRPLYAAPAATQPAGEEAHQWTGRVVEINYETSRFLVRYEGIPPDIGIELSAQAGDGKP